MLIFPEVEFLDCFILENMLLEILGEYILMKITNFMFNGGLIVFAESLFQKCLDKIFLAAIISAVSPESF